MLSETLGQFPLDSFIIRDSKDTHESCRLCPKHWTGGLPNYRPQPHSHVSVQPLSHTRLCDPGDGSTPGLPASRLTVAHYPEEVSPQAKAITREHGCKAEAIESIDRAELKGRSFDTFVFSLHFYNQRHWTTGETSPMPRPLSYKHLLFWTSYYWALQ